MGDFRIIIDAVGDHGQDRDKKDGEIIDFLKDNPNCPEAMAKSFVEQLAKSGCSIDGAKVIHWPLDNYGGQTQNGRSVQVVDDLLTGKRTGSF